MFDEYINTSLLNTFRGYHKIPKSNDYVTIINTATSFYVFFYKHRTYVFAILISNSVYMNMLAVYD